MRMPLAALAAAVFCSGCAGDRRVEELFGGRPCLEPVLSPVKVEAVRVENRTFQPDDPREPFGGYPVIGGPVELDRQAADELSSLLTDPGSYEWNLAKACEFVPGVAARFTGESGTTEVVFCFECDSVIVYGAGQRDGGRDFDRARGEFLQIFQRAFPGDDALQALN